MARDNGLRAFPSLRWYLAVQDGMTAAHVEPVAHRFRICSSATLP